MGDLYSRPETGIERRLARQATRRERRRTSLVRAWVERGWFTSRTERAAHNDYDDACRYWWGDRCPAANDERNREFGGATSALSDRRCVVCRPYDDEDADA